MFTKAQFRDWFIEAVRTVPVDAINEAGEGQSGVHPLGLWINGHRLHNEDAAKHSAGGGYTDAQAVKAVKDKL